nr:L,D-transpeptidase [Streptomyces sp. HNM0574]
MTAAAFAVVGFLAYQADAAQERAEKRKPAASAPSKPSAEERQRQLEALPKQSGQGERVVYSLKRERVWLVTAAGKVKRTYEVGPSTVSPEPGTYQVTSRAAHVTGSDGIPIENVVRFTTVGGTTIGFSAALDGSMPEGDPARKTGGIREKRADGEALWLFAPIGTKVVVAP